MKKKISVIVATLILIVMSLTCVGCGSLGEKVKTTFSEQKVAFYNSTTTEDGEVEYETIDENSTIHLCFPAASKNKIETKFVKAAKLLISMQYKADEKSYKEITFAISLLKANKDNYILLLDDDIKPAVAEAITIDPILEEDATKFSLYYSNECKNEKYYTSGNEGYALKCSIDLAKLSEIARFSTIKDSEVKYTAFSFELITNGGFDSGKINSLYVDYKYDAENNKFVEYIEPAEVVEPETPETPVDPEGEKDQSTDAGEDIAPNSETPEGGEESSTTTETPETEVPEGEKDPTTEGEGAGTEVPSESESGASGQPEESGEATPEESAGTETGGEEPAGAGDDSSAEEIV